MKQTTISLQRRHLMIAGVAGLVAPGVLFAARSGSNTLMPAASEPDAIGSMSEEKLIVSGQILGPDGRPLAGATVEALNAQPGGNYSVTSDADGRFMFTTVAPAGRSPHIQYRVSHAQHGTLARKLRFGGTPAVAGEVVAQWQRDEAGTWRAAVGLTLA